MKKGVPYQTFTTMTQIRAIQPRPSHGTDWKPSCVQNPVEGRIGRIEQPPPAERGQRQRDDPRHQQQAAPDALVPRTGCCA